MPWLSVNHTRLRAVSAVPTPLLALEVHRRNARPAGQRLFCLHRKEWLGCVRKARRSHTRAAYDLAVVAHRKPPALSMIAVLIILPMAGTSNGESPLYSTRPG